MKIGIFFFLFISNVVAEEMLNCKTQKHIGLDFFGKDYETILNYLQLKEFKIKLDRNRNDIYEQEKNKISKKQNLTKTSHFFEIVLLRSSGFAIPMHCSWVFDIRIHKINEGDFSCVGFPKNDKIFSLDYKGNFMYSSKFDEFFKNKKNNTLHSLIGECTK